MAKKARKKVAAKAKKPARRAAKRKTAAAKARTKPRRKVATAKKAKPVANKAKPVAQKAAAVSKQAIVAQQLPTPPKSFVQKVEQKIEGAVAAAIDILTDAERLHHKLDPGVPPIPE
jgi:hypothetical protein